jgi:Guanine nucleotide exchange factor synembryn
VESEPQTSNPGVMRDSWSPRLDGYVWFLLPPRTLTLTDLSIKSFLPPLLRVFHGLPPTSPCPITPPLAHVIHSLITIPVIPTLQSTWLGLPSPSGSPKSSLSGSPESFPGSRSHSSARSDHSSRRSSTLDRALSAIAAGRRSLSRTPPLNIVTYDVLQHAYDLLEVSLSHYLPGNTDPDDPEIRTRCKAESSDTLDDMLSPLVVLITKLCIADEGSRSRVRDWIVPEDLDRSSLLEERSDILGRCLRLLSCVHHSRLKDSVGELLFAIADSDGRIFISFP